MRVLTAVLCAGLLAGCALDRAMPADAPARPAALRISGVPFHPQEGFRCGPAAMAMMLGWAGVKIAPAALEGQFYGEPRDPRVTLVDSARRYGRLAYPVSGMEALEAELAAGHPVLVLQNLGVARSPIWNCAVVVGYDRANGRVQLNSGGEAGKEVSWRLLERLGSDTDHWGLVVLRAGDLPATAAEGSYVEAARGLERAGRYWEAVLAYDTALSLWPSNSDAMMGLGSSLYLLGDPVGAADAFKAAVPLAKDPKPALEALAHVLAEMGRRDEAVATARKAVSISAPLRKPRFEKGREAASE